jgi:hypothetical protein
VNPPPSHRGPQLKRFQPLRVLPPDIHPTKVLFARDRLSAGSLPPPHQYLHSKHVKAFSQDSHVSASTSEVTVYKGLLSTSSYAFRTQEWFNGARDDLLRFAQDTTLSYVVGSLVGRNSSFITSALKTEVIWSSETSATSQLLQGANNYKQVQQPTRHVLLHQI